MNNAVFEKTMKKTRKKRIHRNFSNKKKETIWCQNQILIQQIFYLQIY